MDHLCQAFPEGKERSRHKSKKDFELSLSKAAAELLDLNQLGEPIALWIARDCAVSVFRAG